mgnify:CR=1 FL=1
MRIVAVAHYGLPHNRGGSEIMLHEMLSALARRGHKVRLVVTDVEGDPVDVDGVRVLHGRGHLDDLGSYDVMISHHKEAPGAFELARSAGKPTVLIVHSNLPYNRRFLDTDPDLVVYNTEWVRRHFARLGYNVPSVVVHPPVYGEDHRTVRGDMVTLVNAIPDKGVKTFEAIAKAMPRTRFLLVEGGYLKDRQKRVQLPNVTWQPHTDNMKRDVWSRTRVLLVPSSYESYGMVGVEAMHSGIPVIAHPTPGLRESLGSAGTFINRTDTIRWVRAIRRLWNDEKASQTARKRAQELDPAPELSRFVDAVEAL